MIISTDDGRQGKYKLYLISVLIVVATLFTFSPLFHADFVNIDDPDYVKKNERIRNVDVEHVISFFTSPGGDMYIPLVYLTYAVEYKFFGLNPLIYHVDSVLLHVLNSLLVFWLIWLLTKRLFVSTLMAGLFALHPFHVESVAWISERKDVLYAAFFLGAAIAYHYYCQSRKTRHYTLTLFLFLLSCLSKPMAVTLPVVLLCYDYFYLGKRSWRQLIDKIPFFIISLVVSLLAIKMMNLSFHEELDLKYNVLDRIILVLYSIFFYIQKTLVPMNLSAAYMYPEKSGMWLPVYYICCASVTLFIVASIFFFRKSNPVIKGCFLFFVITIFPVLQFLPNTYTITADRYSYISSLGVLGIVIFLVERMSVYLKVTTRNAWRIGLFSLIILALAAYRRSMIWQNGIALYTDIVEKGQYTDRELCVLGDLYDNSRQPFKALDVFRKADSLYPNHLTVKSKYAYCLAETGQYQAAIDEYRSCLILDPLNEGLYINLGDAYVKAGMPDDALNILLKGHTLFPNNNICLYNLAFVYWEKGFKEVAVTYFKENAARGFAPAINFLKNVNIK